MCRRTTRIADAATPVTVAADRADVHSRARFGAVDSGTAYGPIAFGGSYGSVTVHSGGTMSLTFAG
jgi:hypothetical protein